MFFARTTLVLACSFLQQLTSAIDPIYDADPDVGFFWQISDVHYDPYYTMNGDPLNMCHGVPGHPESQQLLGKYGHSDCDPPMELLSSALQVMVNINSQPDFILWTGDNIGHINKDDFSFDKSFAIIFNVTKRIRDAFVGAKLMPCIGNHDSWPSNTIPIPGERDPSGEMLSSYYSELHEMAGWSSINNILDRIATRSFNKGGYYSQRVAPFLKILNINSMLWFKRNHLAPDNGDPGGQFRWMDKELSYARKHKIKVIVSGHVAPGYMPGTSDALNPTYPAQNAHFLQLLHNYKDVITAAIFGHYHSDTFHLTYSENGIPDIPMFMAPSLTPKGNKNPAFRLFKYRVGTGQLLEYTQFYLNLTEANSGNATWRKHYNTVTAFAMSDLSSSSLDGFVKRLNSPESQHFSHYTDLRSVLLTDTALSSCNSTCKQQYLCAAVFLDISLYNKCLHGGDIVLLLASQSNIFGIKKVSLVVTGVILIVLVILVILAYRRWCRTKLGKQIDKSNMEVHYSLLVDTDDIEEDEL